MSLFLFCDQKRAALTCLFDQPASIHIVFLKYGIVHCMQHRSRITRSVQRFLSALTAGALPHDDLKNARVTRTKSEIKHWKAAYAIWRGRLESSSVCSGTKQNAAPPPPLRAARRRRYQNKTQRRQRASSRCSIIKTH